MTGSISVSSSSVKIAAPTAKAVRTQRVFPKCIFGGTRRSGRVILSFCVLALALLHQGCGSVRKASDPEAVRVAIVEAQEQERQLVQATIQDPGRTERFLALMDERDNILRRHVAEIEEYRAAFERLNSDYHADRKEFESLVAQYNEQRGIAQDELVKLLEAMKRATTKAEWQVIAKFQKENLNPRDLSYGGGLTEES